MRFAPLFAAGLGLACSDDGTLTCTAKACIGVDASIMLVDAAGNTVAARGEYRVTYRAGGIQLPSFFDCTGQTDSDSSRCRNGVISLSGANPDAVVELRYQLDAGELEADEPETYTEWERLEIQYSERIDPDFNGPGCSCIWYQPISRAALVPEAARRPLP